MIVVEPYVELLAYTQLPPGRAEDSCSDPARVVERCGRVSWKSEGKSIPGSAGDFCVRVVNIRKDESIAEHSSVTLLVVTDRYAMAQLTRHRIAAWTVESTHYINYTKAEKGGEIAVCRPLGIPVDSPAFSAWKAQCEAAEKAYFEIVGQGHKHYHARFVLPGCLKTELAMTMNLRSWKHVLGLRTPPNNTPEIRYVMWRAALILADLCPEMFSEWRKPGEEYFARGEWTK